VHGVAERLTDVERRIADAAARAGRDPARVRLVAVSKTFPASRVLEAVSAGLRTFGENRVQEATAKIPAVAAAASVPIEWHMVGQLQRNKARKAVELFDVIQSVDRTELAAALARAAADLGRRPRILLQVNVDEEAQKAGVLPKAAAQLLADVDRLPQLAPVGLMALPRACDDPEEVRPSFARLRSLLDDLNAGRPDEQRLAELSMGMTADFEVAVEEGATWVRLGTAIFGERKKP
jgi:pyridoxal phosphate enzyme (YggS family)